MAVKVAKRHLPVVLSSYIAGQQMLVLSRKLGERIQIGDEISITVVRITNAGVRLGVETPEGAVVVRSELCNNDRDESSLADDSETAPTPKPR